MGAHNGSEYITYLPPFVMPPPKQKINNEKGINISKFEI
jgi:hypothetical protein